MPHTTTPTADLLHMVCTAYNWRPAYNWSPNNIHRKNVPGFRLSTLKQPLESLSTCRQAVCTRTFLPLSGRAKCSATWRGRMLLSSNSLRSSFLLTSSLSCLMRSLQRKSSRRFLPIYQSRKRTRRHYLSVSKKKTLSIIVIASIEMIQNDLLLPQHALLPVNISVMVP